MINRRESQAHTGRINESSIDIFIRTFDGCSPEVQREILKYYQEVKLVHKVTTLDWFDPNTAGSIDLNHLRSEIGMMTREDLRILWAGYRKVRPRPRRTKAEEVGLTIRQKLILAISQLPSLETVLASTDVGILQQWFGSATYVWETSNEPMERGQARDTMGVIAYRLAEIIDSWKNENHDGIPPSAALRKTATSIIDRCNLIAEIEL